MIQVGDEIKWNLPIGGYLTYKVLAIDLTRPTAKFLFTNGLPSIEIDNQVLIQWFDFETNCYKETWAYNYQALNDQVVLGRIKIVKRLGLPYTELKKFSFV